MPSSPSTPKPVGWYASDPSPAVRQPLSQSPRRVNGLLGNCAISPMAGRSPKISDREPMAMRATSTRARVNGTGSIRRRSRVTPETPSSSVPIWPRRNADTCAKPPACSSRTSRSGTCRMRLTSARLAFTSPRRRRFQVQADQSARACWPWPVRAAYTDAANVRRNA